MNVSVYLFLVVTGAMAVVLATTPTMEATTAKMTGQTTTEGPTTGPQTTHSPPTTAPKTTHSQPTTAPKTTHDNHTTAARTTTYASNATTHHTPGQTTESPTHYTTVAGNTTSEAAGSTVGTTTPVQTTVPEAEDVITSYQFKNGSEVCMLFAFEATLKIKYYTTNNTVGEAIVPIGRNTSGVETNWFATSVCKAVAPRYFDISGTYAVPVTNETGYVSLDFRFLLSGPNYKLGILAAYWTYIEPFFPRDTVNYGTLDAGDFGDVYTGTMGKSFGCQTLRLTERHLTIILDHVMLQPFANLANGSFGDVENCTSPTTMGPTMEQTTANATTANATTASPHRPTKPSPINGGMIAGIVIGVLAFIALIVGTAVFVVRKRRMKGAAYGNLEEDHTEYIH